MRLFFALLLIMSGLLTGIYLGPYLHTDAIKAISAAGFFIAIAGSYFVVRYFLVRESRALKTPAAAGEKSEMGFVVDTFQELVSKLKGKEKELEKLRMSAEDRAESMESYNENILQSVPSGVVSTDNSMVIKSINQSAENILGVKAVDVINRDFEEIFDEPLIGIMRNSVAVSRGEYLYHAKNSRNIWLGVTVSQLKNAANEAMGRILVFTDLTEVKALQVQVELKKRLTQLGEMSAGIAHELRNPMSVIAGYAKLLSKKVAENEKETVDAILTEISSIDKIISEFLAFAKPTDVNKTALDLKQMIKETSKAALGINDKMKVTIDADNSVPVMADEVLLRQALSNLFVNAFESMPEGGTLDIKLEYSQDKVELKIKDTGEGIPDDIIQKVFLPFYTSKANGIGLGLAIAQKVVISHGGSIEVDSKEGEGTTFLITLPLGS
ncbi:MAG TPA: PAS domain-containing protein [Nitrospirae bacterium]|nr:PAS domain-containing protein [Nitrospirota bacterium]